MTIQRTIVDGEHATVADMPGGYVKILFDDGRMIIGKPAAPPQNEADKEQDE